MQRAPQPDRRRARRPAAALLLRATARELAAAEGIDVERARAAVRSLWSMIASCASRRGRFVDGPLVEFLRVVYENPEILLWERFWVERNKALDRELYGIVKFCDTTLEFGLNVWNRNHFNPWRKAQWPWDEQTQWADWVKPIVYQHQSGGIFFDEWTPLLAGVLRDLEPEAVIEVVKSVLGLREAAGDSSSKRASTRTRTSRAKAETPWRRSEAACGCTWGSASMHRGRD